MVERLAGYTVIVVVTAGRVMVLVEVVSLIVVNRTDLCQCLLRAAVLILAHGCSDFKEDA